MRTRSEALSLAGLRRMERSVGLLDIVQFAMSGDPSIAPRARFLAAFERREEGFLELPEEPRRGLDVPAAVAAISRSRPAR